MCQQIWFVVPNHLLPNEFHTLNIIVFMINDHCDSIKPNNRFFCQNILVDFYQLPVLIQPIFLTGVTATRILRWFHLVSPQNLLFLLFFNLEAACMPNVSHSRLAIPMPSHEWVGQNILLECRRLHTQFRLCFSYNWRHKRPRKLFSWSCKNYCGTIKGLEKQRTLHGTSRPAALNFSLLWTFHHLPIIYEDKLFINKV